MATNYTLEESVIALAERAEALKGLVENETPDLEAVSVELAYISGRANELRVASVEIDKVLSEL